MRQTAHALDRDEGGHAIGRSPAPSAVREGQGKRLELPRDELMTIPGLLLDMVDRRGSAVALRTKSLGVYREMSWNDVVDRVSSIGLGLYSLGVRPGDRIAIVGDPLADWLFSDFAAQSIGAISFGLYPTSSPNEFEFTLKHGGASVLIAEDQEHVDKVLPLIERLPDLKKIVVIDASNMFGYDHPALMLLDELVALGGKSDARLFRDLCRAVKPDDPATIVYTSGTSANPKGALYRHRALVAQGHQFFAFPELDDSRDIRSVVHLPLNHLYERMNTPLGMLVKNIVPHFGEEADRFIDTFADVAPQHIASVPRYWSKIASRVIVGIESASALKQACYRAAMRVGQEYRRRRWVGQPASFYLPLYGVARLLVFDRMLKKIGLHRVRIALSAGAPLPPEVQGLWQVWGVNLKNLYGQTEGGVVTAQLEPFPRPGSVGRPYPGVTIRIEDDQEITVVTPGAFAGYWQDDATTAEAMSDSIIKTGDVGEFDETGDLHIVDRKKDIVITAGGKNVSPSRIETALKSSPYVSEASVVGEGRKYLTALVEIDYESVSEWARAHSVSYTTYESLVTNREIYGLIAQEVEKGNGLLGRVEQVKAFRILDRELDPEMEGEAVTATRKIKRSLLHKHFGHLIDQMYSDDEDARISRQMKQ